MSFRPLIVDQGLPQQLPAGQAINAGGWDLPAAGGTILYVMVADASGHAVWTQLDHGTHLAGSLGDDDHTLYHTDARGDARYYTETELDAGQLDNRYFTEAEHLVTSAGAADSGKPIKLDAGGHVDATMINDSDVDHGSIGGLGDDDHTLYSLVDGTRPFSGVVGGVIPTDHAHLATKEYVDSAIQVIQPLFLLDAAHASIASCKNTQVFDSGLAQADVTTASVVDDQALQAWADATAESIARDIPAGVFALHLHAEKTSGQENLQLYFKIFEVDSGFSETLIMTSETSDEITSEEHVAIHSVLGAPYAISVGSWVLIRVYATVTGSGNAPTAALYYQGATSARFDLPTLAITIDHGHLLGLADDDHTAYHTDARAAAWLAANHETTYAHANYDTAYGWGDHASVGYLKADGSVPLTANWAAGAYNITGLALLTVDNITINAATIVSDTGAISFNDENVSTLGTMVGSNIPSPASVNRMLVSTGFATAAWSVLYTDGVLTTDGSQTITWVAKPFGFLLAAPSGDNQVLISTAADVASWNMAGNNQFLASGSSGEVRWEDKTGDASLWIATTGNDSTGDGTEGDPFATIGKCITEFQAMSFDPGDTATIYLEDGEYAPPTTTLPRMVPMLKLAGRAAYTFTMSDTVSQSSVAGDVYDLRITLDTTTNISAGNFVVISRCAALPEINGCWEVQTVHDSTDITIRVTWARETPHIGVYAATVYVPRAHLYKAGASLLLVYTRLALNGLIFEGTAGQGVQLFPGATLEIRSHVGFSGWGYGLYVYAATVDIQYCAISDCTQGMYLVNVSSGAAQWIAISGCSKGYSIDRHSHLYIGAESYAASNAYGLILEFNSSAKIFSTIFINNTVQGVLSSYGSFVRLAGCTDTNNVSYTSPAFDTLGNDRSWITT